MITLVLNAYALVTVSHHYRMLIGIAKSHIKEILTGILNLATERESNNNNRRENVLL